MTAGRRLAVYSGSRLRDAIRAFERQIGNAMYRQLLADRDAKLLTKGREDTVKRLICQRGRLAFLHVSSSTKFLPHSITTLRHRPVDLARPMRLERAP